MIQLKLYLYDSTQEENGYRGTDLSQYVLQGGQYKEDLTQELDTSEITLQGYPTREEFAPTTKFILDVESNESVYYTYHIVVAEDIVTQPILSDDEYFVHTISFVEASAIAQKRLVDNISATYKLKFVSLKEIPTFDINTIRPYRHENSIYTPNENFSVNSIGTFAYVGKYFDFEGDIKLIDKNDLAKQTYYNLNEDLKTETREGVTYYRATFTLPKCAIYFGDNHAKTFTKIGYASLDYTIKDYDADDKLYATHQGTIESNSEFPNMPWVWFWGDYSSIPSYLKTMCLPEKYGIDKGVQHLYIKQYSRSDATMPSGTWETNEIDVFVDHRYEVSVSVHDYNTPDYKYIYKDVPSKITRTSSYMIFGHKTSITTFSELESTSKSEFKIYSIASLPVTFQSANPYSALSLIQKAIVNSGIYEKKNGVYIGDTNKRDDNGKLVSNLPFYIDDEFVGELNSTIVNENFYNQKNLWEVLLEVGYYIHAIPEIKFGEDDKFMITFTRLGSTNYKENNGTRINITNFRGIEDYISSTSSYIANMVQLGGQIEEVVAPKTNDENYLIYNDTATLQVSKPIIEILDIKVKCNSDQYEDIGIYEDDEADFTKLVYEKNVYDILPIDYTLSPNKGMSLYYELGDNAIKGGDYRLPTPNSGDLQNDLAIKKAIYSAFNIYEGINPTISPSAPYWSTIFVNDFTFTIKYRTKSNIRQNQTRPDLRKYIVSSKYDEVPKQAQFNNQEDVLVDSEKFGNMVYGKLIRTGNTNYQMTEWHDDLYEIKHKGELYTIDNNNYYVGKVTHYFYVNHIVSVVEYSKDFNQLSQIVGIPSEPRFYEISEQSAIKRDVCIDDYLLLTKRKFTISGNSKYLSNSNHLLSLLFGVGNNTSFAKWVNTTFKGDKDVGQTGDMTRGQSNHFIDILTPLNAYSSQNTLTYSWEMKDNYGAGDKVIYKGLAYDGAKSVNREIDSAYTSMRAVRYCDIYGKASLFDFYILEDVPSLEQWQIQRLPLNSVFTSRNETPVIFEAITGSQDYNYLVSFPNLEDEALFNENETYDLLYNDGEDIRTITIEYDGGWKCFTSYITTSGTYSCTIVDKTLLDQEMGGEVSVLAHNSLKPYYGYNGFGLSLLKDNRETIRFNYNIQMLTDTDQYVLSPYLFEDNKVGVKLVLLSEEVNKISYGFIESAKIITPKNTSGTSINKYFDLQFEDVEGTIAKELDLGTILANVNENHFNGNENYEQVKSIAIIYNVNEGEISTYKNKFVVARNIPSNSGKVEAITNWYIGAPRSDYFANRQ